VDLSSTNTVFSRQLRPLLIEKFLNKNGVVATGPNGGGRASNYYCASELVETSSPAIGT
jgi:hypothetical protein